MPELPEVETMRRGILTAVGSRIEAVAKLRTKQKPILVRPVPSSMNRRASGREIVAVDRIGKRVVLLLDSEDRLVFEPRMTGLVLVADPPSVEHLRFRVDVSGGPLRTIWYWDQRGLGTVQLHSPRQFERVVARFGPDALSVTAQQLHEQLHRSKRPIKVALLDQQRVAGIGNLYASEILHLAAIHPAKRCHRLTRPEWKRIQAATQAVLNDAIVHEGSTLSDGTYRNTLNNSGGYQNYHRVYGRAGELCLTCGRTPIERVVQAQRSTFFCPRCQRGSR